MHRLAGAPASRLSSYQLKERACLLRSVHPYNRALAARPHLFPTSTGQSARRNRHMSALPGWLRTEPEAGDDIPGDYFAMMPDWDKKRRAGVLVHPTSLPGPYGTGELGPECNSFVDWLSDAGMQCWQVLPLVPPDPLYFSPYSGTDSNCGNPLLISIDRLIEMGLLDASDAPAHVPVGNVDFVKVVAVKAPLLAKAAKRLLSRPASDELRKQFEAFRTSNPWVEDSALFDSLCKQPDLAEFEFWWEWPSELRYRDGKALAAAREQHKEAIQEFVAVQFIFDVQWKAVKAYANSKGVKIIGDMPIYVGGHSADVWVNRHLFELTDTGAPGIVSGVPPDAFSETGQLWGSPLYRWKAHKKEGFKWWGARMARALELYDETRVDHFRAFAGYWAIDGKSETAMVGTWKKGPGMELFDSLKKQLGTLPILAEDLGVITTDVVALREGIGAPGMVVLQFAWGGGPSNVHLPHNHYENSFCYPGTHDNETSVGWYKSTQDGDRDYLRKYLSTDGKDVAWDFIWVAMESVSRTSIIMMQDIMRLDNSARMNSPGVAAGNWSWRMGGPDIYAKLSKEAAELRRLAELYGRLAPKPKKSDEAQSGTA